MSAETALIRLAPFIREFMYREGWEGLRPVQVAAIDQICAGEGDILISAATASGKTEAAFLPILSEIADDPVGSVRVLYVGPLKALINDQFARLEALCRIGEIPVYRWHGDVGRGDKESLIKCPGGVLQITPESIESLFINRGGYLPKLFGGLRYIVIDEVHSFVGTDRGVQLRNQLERLSGIARFGRPRRIGLSATLADDAGPRSWLAPRAPSDVTVLHYPATGGGARLSHLHFHEDTEGLAPQLYDDLFDLSRNRRTLIFCAARRHVELVTVELNRRCRLNGLDDRYAPHHGSIAKEIREAAEERMRGDSRPYSIVCTSTMEMGIDIGRLDLVVQINGGSSVNSFVQRLGRSGRRDQPRTMQIYTTSREPDPKDEFYERLPFNLLLSVAVVQLFQSSWLEPSKDPARPFSVLYHQILSMLAHSNGMHPRELIGVILRSGSFPHVEPEEHELLLRHLAEYSQIEQLATGELIVGLAGERVLRSRDFYAVFESPPEWEVFHGGTAIGRITPTALLAPGLQFLLGGRPWAVESLHPENKAIMVVPAPSSRIALFEGEGPEIHRRVVEVVREVLIGHQIPTHLDDHGTVVLQAARDLAKSLQFDRRQLFETPRYHVILPWTGSRAVWTFMELLRAHQLKAAAGYFPWVVTVEKNIDAPELRRELYRILNSDVSPETLISAIPLDLLTTHKFDEHLPEELVRRRAVDELVDWEGARALLVAIVDATNRPG